MHSWNISNLYTNWELENNQLLPFLITTTKTLFHTTAIGFLITMDKTIFLNLALTNQLTVFWCKHGILSSHNFSKQENIDTDLNKRILWRNLECLACLLRLTGVLEAGGLGGPDGPARPAGPTYLLRLEVDMSSWHMQVVVLKRLELRREVSWSVWSSATRWAHPNSKLLPPALTLIEIRGHYTFFSHNSMLQWFITVLCEMVELFWRLYYEN